MSSTDKQQIPPIKSRRYTVYRDRLLKAGFTEAERCTGHFFRQSTDQAAFVINLDDDKDGLFVLYGFASTAYMAGDEEWFAQNGSFNDTCHVRNIIFVCDENEDSAVGIITGFYNQYKNYSKDEILALKKEKQKAFLNRFSYALKPLGFKKKGTKWTLDLKNGTALTFEAQKSAFSDEYYFNVIIHAVTDFYERQSYTRVVNCNRNIYNWQLMTEKQTDDFISYTLDNYIFPIIMK